ncbi:unnamed protein product [Symbiodinium sp. KB8]|nr:unnamed protein product [Symbiodinium sp. KB8]
MRGLKHGSGDVSGAVRLWTTQGEIGLHRTLSALFGKKDQSEVEELNSTPSPEKSKEAAPASTESLQALQSCSRKAEPAVPTEEKLLEERVDLDRASLAEEGPPRDVKESTAYWMPPRRKRPSTPAKPRKSARVLSEDYRSEAFDKKNVARLSDRVLRAGMKRPAAAGDLQNLDGDARAEDSGAARKASKKEQIQDLLSTEKEEPAEGEEEDEPVEDPEVNPEETRDRSKTRYLQSLREANGLPDWFRDVFDKNLKRSQRTELVNKTVRKNKKGKLELVVQSPADLAVAVPSLRQELVSYASEETVGRKRLKGMPETLARNQCGGQAGFERALANGELVRIKQDGATFYAWKEITVDHSTGSTKRTVGNSGSMQIDDKDFQQLQQQADAFDIALASKFAQTAAKPSTDVGQKLFGSFEEYWRAVQKSFSQVQEATLLGKVNGQPVGQEDVGELLRQTQQSLQGLNEADSKLAAVLLGRYSWGHLPSILIQIIAAAALQDYETGALEQVKVLARLGNNGLCPQNIDRDLQRKLGDNKYASSSEEVLPLKRLLLNPRRLTFANLRYPMMAPHNVFASIYRHYGAAWRRLFVPSGEELERFWTSLEGWPGLANSDILLVPNYKRVCVPLILHGDGVAITAAGKASQKTAYVFSWRCPFSGELPSRTSHQLITMIWNDDVSKANGGRTKEAFWQRLKGSLDLLFEGVDEQGRELAGGYRGCLIGIAGDLEFFQSWLGFKGATANFPCARCPLHKDELMDWRNTASWRRHTYRKGEDWHQAQGHNHGALFHGKNKLSSLNLLPDIMHTKFLGVDQYAYGSCLHKLIYRHMPGAPEDNLQSFMEDAKDVWKNEAKQLDNLMHKSCSLRLSLFTDPVKPYSDFPRLKTKAAETKNLGMPLLSAWRQYALDDAQEHTQARLLLETSVEMDDLLDSTKGKWRPSQAEARKLRVLIDSLPTAISEVMGV